MTDRDRLSNRRGHETFEMVDAGMAYVVGVGRYDDGRLAEVFLNSGKSGVQIQAWARDAAVLLSLALQHGCPVPTIRDALTREDSGDASGPVGRLLDLIEGPNTAPANGGQRIVTHFINIWDRGTPA